jgi:Josephin
MYSTRRTRKIRRNQAGGQPYRESQKELLCGQHAINHILQEPKFVWNEKSTDIFIPAKPADKDERAHAQDPKVKINLYADCKAHDKEEQEKFGKEDFEVALKDILDNFKDEKPIVLDESKIVIDDSKRKQYRGKTDAEIKLLIMKGRRDFFEKQQARRREIQDKYAGKTDQEIEEEFRKEYEAELGNNTTTRFCEYGKGSQGNIDIRIFERWRKVLNYGGGLVDANYGFQDLLAVALRYLDKVITSRNDLLGAMFPTGKHYYAFVMYDGVCEPNRRKETDPKKKKYAFIDSLKYSMEKGICKLKAGEEECYTKDELFKKIREINPSGVLFFFGYNKDGTEHNPYKSVAYKQMKNYLDSMKSSNGSDGSSSSGSSSGRGSETSDPKQADKSSSSSGSNRKRTTRKVKFAGPLNNNNRASVTAVKG